ncbi:uncharacterized protein LOC110609917 [Manihot esculenta]|uniref:Uncharacterized protein n=1 Tax=Manihot esculenta TaxID=3983 RepID=A0A2C9W9W9_MANES|nr:uncharacterized protein LOC110609917 [Manihot esculenta]OAY56360.1 hypothetical protein MANES_02G009900v8 [Manihot esculenta]
MGNCLKPSARQRQQEEEVLKKYYDQVYQERELGAEFGKESDDDFDEKGSLKVKIVLTKEELEWLMLQLKVNEGKKLEDVLQEIERERERGKVKSWKPSLESILESPEGLEMERL